MELKYKSSCPEENLILLSQKGCLISPKMFVFVVSFEIEINEFGARLIPLFYFLFHLSALEKITAAYYNLQSGILIKSILAT